MRSSKTRWRTAEVFLANHRDVLGAVCSSMSLNWVSSSNVWLFFLQMWADSFPDSTGRLKGVVLRFNSPSPFNSSSWRRTAHSKFSKCETASSAMRYVEVTCRGRASFCSMEVFFDCLMNDYQVAEKIGNS